MLVPLRRQAEPLAHALPRPVHHESALRRAQPDVVLSASPPRVSPRIRHKGPTTAGKEEPTRSGRHEVCHRRQSAEGVRGRREWHASGRNFLPAPALLPVRSTPALDGANAATAGDESLSVGTIRAAAPQRCPHLQMLRLRRTGRGKRRCMVRAMGEGATCIATRRWLERAREPGRSQRT